MKRLWRWLVAMDTGTVLILMTGLWLAAGAVTMWLVPSSFRPLLTTSLVDWFPTVAGRLHVWWWMVPLVVTVTVMGVSTAACVVDCFTAALRASDRGIRRRHLGFVAFHLCVLFFLLGHLFMEFTGDNLTVPLVRGREVAVPAPGLTLTLTFVDERPVEDMDGAPVRRRLVLDVIHGRDGVRSWCAPAVLEPARIAGWHLHVPMFGRIPDGCDAVVQLRRNPGLVWFMAGAVVLVLAMILAGPVLARRVLDEVSHHGEVA